MRSNGELPSRVTLTGVAAWQTDPTMTGKTLGDQRPVLTEDYVSALEDAVVGLSGVRDLPLRILANCKTHWRDGRDWQELLHEALPTPTLCAKQGHEPMISGFCAVCREWTLEDRPDPRRARA